MPTIKENTRLETIEEHKNEEALETGRQITLKDKQIPEKLHGQEELKR